MATSHPHRGALAVITGASSGIGYELAKIFARNEYRLIVAAEDPGIEMAAEEFRRFGVQVDAVQVDLATESGVDELYRRIQASAVPVEAIAMNAGVGVGGEFLTTSLEAELKMIQLNIVSLVRLTKKVLPDLVARGHGRILFTSSIAGEMPAPYLSVYGATKAFVQSFSEAIREEVKDTGVTVTALQPGPTETEFFRRANMMDTKVGQSKKDDAALVARDGYEALMEGKDHVVAGSFKNKVQVAAAKFGTETASAKMHGAQTKPGYTESEHH